MLQRYLVYVIMLLMVSVVSLLMALFAYLRRTKTGADDFKQVNDVYGHRAGDAVLKPLPGYAKTASAQRISLAVMEETNL